MRRFWKRDAAPHGARMREAKSFGPMTALSDLRAAYWSSAGVLAREGFERNAVVYRCVRMISEAAASLPFRASEPDGLLARLMRRPNQEQAGPDLMETFYGHLVIGGASFLEAVSIDGEVRELFALRPERMRALKGPRGCRLAGSIVRAARHGGSCAKRMAFCRCCSFVSSIPATTMRDMLRWRRRRGRWTSTMPAAHGPRR